MAIATLVYYCDGFTYTKPMMALNKWIADWATPTARRACLAKPPSARRSAKGFRGGSGRSSPHPIPQIHLIISEVNHAYGDRASYA
jgi:hypothetical protein